MEQVHGAIKSDAERREEAYDLLAHHVKQHVDMEKVYQLISKSF